MILFLYGFEHKGFLYGWYKKELYRLPSESGIKNYSLKKLEMIKVGRQKGYRCKRDKLSLVQLRDKTIFINKKIYRVQNNKDCPF